MSEKLKLSFAFCAAAAILTFYRLTLDDDNPDPAYGIIMGMLMFSALILNLWDVIDKIRKDDDKK